MENFELLSEQIKRYRDTYKNWIRVMYSVKKGRNPIKCILKNGIRMSLDYDTTWAFPRYHHYLGVPLDELQKFRDSKMLNFKYRGTPVNLKVYLENKLIGGVLEVFCTDDYKFLDCRNSIVIDIGANIGDTPMYFALNGAEKVIALEPYHPYYEIAMENVKNNNLDKSVTLLNAGYGKDGSMIMKDPHFEFAPVTPIRSSRESIETYSLRSIINNFGLEDSDRLMLKVDCEGCEYNLLNEKHETIMKFHKIQIEYHYGFEKLMKFLENLGYRTRYTKPKKQFSPENQDLMTYGYIFAEKKE